MALWSMVWSMVVNQWLFHTLSMLQMPACVYVWLELCQALYVSV